MTGKDGATRTTLWRTLAVLAFFALLTTLHTWPLLSQLSSAISPNRDATINLWALNDQAGQLLRDPQHPLDGRIHYPYPHTLAYVDHQIANALLAIPLVAGGVDRIVVYNVVLLASFFLSGLFCFLLVRDLTGSMAAGLVAGSAFAFSTYRFYHLVHLHLLGTQWLPLALLALHRFLARPSWMRLLGVVGAGFLVALSSWHLAVIGALGLGVVAVSTMLADGRPLLRRASALVVGAALVGLALVPLATIYSATAAEWGRPGGETTGNRVDMSSRPASFVSVPEGARTPYSTLLRRPIPPPPAFPGVIVLLFAVPAVWTLLRFSPARSRARRARVLFWLACAPAILVFVAASLGPRWLWVVDGVRPVAPVVIFCAALLIVGVRFARRVRGADMTVVVALTYTALAVAGGLFALGPYVFVGDVNIGRGVYWPDNVPPLSLLRAPERFALLFSLGMSVLAGVGLARVLRHQSGRASWVVAAAVLIALNLDARHAPITFDVVPPSTPPVYAWLAQTQEEGAVLEYPDNRWAVYHNLSHGRRMVQGHAYIRPYLVNFLEERPALSQQHLTLLWEHLHPRFIVVRMGLYPSDLRAEVMTSIREHPEALRLRARFGDDYVYELIDRGVGTHLYRVWPKSELEHRTGFTLTGRVTGGRDGIELGLVATLNGVALLDRWGDEVTRATPRVLWIDHDRLSPGQNTLEVRADYRFGDGALRHAIGTTGVTVAADVVVTASLDRASVEVNGRSERVDKGYFLAVLDADTGQITDMGSFNTSWYREDSDSLAAFVEKIPLGSPVVVSSQFDVSRRLTDDAVRALHTLGLAEDLRGQFNWLHAAIGVKGAPPGSALERAEPYDVQLTLGELARPRVELSGLSVN